MEELLQTMDDLKHLDMKVYKQRIRQEVHCRRLWSETQVASTSDGCTEELEAFLINEKRKQL